MKCIECPKRHNMVCTAHAEAKVTLDRDFPPHPFSGCVVPIVDAYCAMIKPGMRVLEIGCGSWSKVKDRCDAVGAHYDGVDVIDEYYGKKTVATRLENVAALSFADEQFDFVIGNQTLEHWGEYGCRTAWGLQQCFRVLKSGGQLLMNVPLYFHGVTPFLMGRVDVIRATIAPFSDTVELTHWGAETAPLAPHFSHPHYPPLKGKVAHVLDIRATKDKPFRRVWTNRFAANGLVARLLNNPPTYVLYQALGRIGLISFR
jgi:SAM-dependent methyltransferase